MFSGALPLEILGAGAGAGAWPAGVPVQLHVAAGDPKRNREWDGAFLAEVRRAGAPADLFEYPVAGHLFTDPSLPQEYDEAATELLWERVLAFGARAGAQASAR
jgi:dienelactone hydrolase